MYPTGLCDIIEIHQLSAGDFPIRFSQSGIRFESNTEKNLCFEAWKLLAAEIKLPHVAIHLHKQIPVGAGLGGGSSNASTVLKGLNLLAKSPAPPERLTELAGQLGSDCPFFLHNGPMMMEGTGELLTEVNVSLRQYFLVLLFPKIHISTSEAYKAVQPSNPEFHLRQWIEAPIERWKSLIANDFEKSAFIQYPLLKELKRSLYMEGAKFASMSGSGSSLYGIFETLPDLPLDIQNYVIWKGSA
jgi:4-diphosphocytidyl-2-C-methyl-D-erythritol kinase